LVLTELLTLQATLLQALPALPLEDVGSSTMSTHVPISEAEVSDTVGKIGLLGAVMVTEVDEE